jgi:hypothetical protein
VELAQGSPAWVREEIRIGTTRNQPKIHAEVTLYPSRFKRQRRAGSFREATQPPERSGPALALEPAWINSPPYPSQLCIHPLHETIWPPYAASMSDPYAAHKSIPSILAIVAALLSFWVQSGIAGIVLAITAIVLGVIGFLLSLAPGIEGGVLSLAAMLLGIIGAVCGLLRAAFHLGQHL